MKRVRLLLAMVGVVAGAGWIVSSTGPNPEEAVEEPSSEYESGVIEGVHLGIRHLNARPTYYASGVGTLEPASVCDELTTNHDDYRRGCLEGVKLAVLEWTQYRRDRGR